MTLQMGISGYYNPTYRGHNPHIQLLEAHKLQVEPHFVGIHKPQPLVNPNKEIKISAIKPRRIITHTIHVPYIYSHLVDFYGTCRWIYLPITWIRHGSPFQRGHFKTSIFQVIMKKSPNWQYIPLYIAFWGIICYRSHLLGKQKQPLIVSFRLE